MDDRLGEAAQRLMGMSDAVWMRHANPLSGWTRMATTPLLFWAVWSHVWIGWKALAPIALLAAWLWLNPRIFPKPKQATAWMTKVVLGERVWLNRTEVPIPLGFSRVATVTTWLSAGMALLAIAGFITQNFWLAFLAWHFAAFAKIWFADRMVWLWDVMKDEAPLYSQWRKELTGA